MEQLHVIREIYLGFGSLITFTLFIFVLYLLFFLRFTKNLDTENQLLLKSLAVTISFICLLCLIKQVISEFTFLTYPNSVKYIIAGNILQIYLPIQIYTLQRSYGYFSKLRDVVIISASVFLFNILLLTASFFIGTEKLTALQYLIQISIIILIVFHYYTLNATFKEVFNTSNENSYSLKGDIFLFVTTSTITLILSLSLFTGLTVYKTEGLKLIIGAINIILLIKVIYYSMPENEVTALIGHSPSLASIDNNDLNNVSKDKDLKNRLLHYFETEKPYLNSNLKITEVALYLYSNKTYLSRLINDHYNFNFNQFVNGHRIEAAKKLFLQDNQININQLCDQSGFGSMATFTMAFRLYLGKSPAEWCKEQRIKTNHDKQDQN